MGRRINTGAAKYSNEFNVIHFQIQVLNKNLNNHNRVSRGWSLLLDIYSLEFLAVVADSDLSHSALLWSPLQHSNINYEMREPHRDYLKTGKNWHQDCNTELSLWYKLPPKWAIPVKFRSQIFLFHVNAAFKAATVHNPYKCIVMYECMSCVWMIWLFIQENIITLVINLGWTHQYWRPVETRIIIIIRQRQISNIDSQPFTESYIHNQRNWGIIIKNKT